MRSSPYRSMFRVGFVAVAMVLALTVIGSGQLPGGPPASPVDPTYTAPTDATASPEERAAAVGAMYSWLQSKFGVADPASHFKATELVKDNMGHFHGKVDQISRGIKVRSGHLVASIRRAAPTGQSLTATSAWAVDDARSHGTYLDDADSVDIKPKLTRRRAIAIVKQLARAEAQRLAAVAAEEQSLAAASEQSLAAARVESKKEKPEQDRPNRNLQVAKDTPSEDASLEIHPGGGRGQRKLTYHVTVKERTDDGPIQIDAWVDQDGNVLEAFNNAQTYVINGRGHTFYQGLQGLGYGINYFNVDYWPAAGAYVLNDNNLRIGSYDMYGTGTTYQSSVSGCCGPFFGNGTLGNRNSTNSDVYVSTVQSYSFMYWVLGRNFVNGSGGPRVFNSTDGLGPLISARNHVGVNYNNAYWDGQMINIGDGDGVAFGSLSTLDIIGHEWQHGVTQYTAGLNYSYESGALNEAFSDIMGAMTERYWYGESSNTWKIGEDSYTPGTGGDALRYMNAPWLGGQPWNYPGRYTGSGDNGGVHINSGIANYAFYILAKGGCGYICIYTPIGADAATQIFYRALRYYMIPSDNFYWARYTTLWAAEDLYGAYSNEWYQTWYAWNAVGVPS